MAGPVDDNMNEVIRKAAELVPSTTDCYRLRVTVDGGMTIIESGFATLDETPTEQIITVTSTWQQVVASPATDRVEVLFQNQSNRRNVALAYGNTGAVGTGFIIPRRFGQVSLAFDSTAVPIYLSTATGSANIYISEYRTTP